MRFASIFLALLLGAERSVAAPCCGGASAVPALITGDEAQNLSASLSMTSVVADAQGALSGQLPVFRDDRSIQEQKRTLLLNYAALIDGDRLQAGASVPLVQTEVKAGSRPESQWGLGDVSLVVGYEALPEYEYTRWIPRVFLFTQATLPTSKSIYEAGTVLATDARGINQWQAALGVAAVKRWSEFDGAISAKLTRIFGREFTSNASDVSRTEIGSSVDTVWSIGGGWSPSERVRIGDQLAMEYQSPFEVIADGSSQGATSQRMFWTNTLSLTYLAGMDDSWVLSYIDQTLFGPAINAALSRGVSLAYVHRIER